MSTWTTVTADNYSVTFTAADRSYEILKAEIADVRLYPEDTSLVEVVLTEAGRSRRTFERLFLDFNSVTNPSESTAAGLLAAVNGLVIDGGTPDNVGSAEAGVVATESGDKDFHKTSLTLTNVNLGTIAGAANEATGALVYTLPAGNVQIIGAYMAIELTNTDGNIDADTPDLGVGTTVASGAVAVLGGTAAFENIITGQTAGDVNGAATRALVDVALQIDAAADRTVYLNVADGWAGAETTGVVANGNITLIWTYVA